MNTTKLELQFLETDPSLVVTSHKYDEEGNVVGEKTLEELTAEREQLKGKLQVRCVLMDMANNESIAIVGPVFDPADKIQRRAAYVGFGSVLSHTIRHRLWPQDTMRYKITNGPHGKRAEIGGYPGDDESR